MTRPDPADEDILLLRAGLLAGVLNVEAVTRCARALKANPGSSAGEMLLRLGLCSPQQLQGLIEAIGSQMMRCRACGRVERVPRDARAASCSACRGALALCEPGAPGGLPAGGRAGAGASEGPGRYTIGGEIGRGALGRVLAAKDQLLGRDVAVKEMILHTDDPALMRRFLREGEVAGRLLHPNIIPVFDVGIREEGGGRVPYFVMGRVQGHDLLEIIKALADGGFEARSASVPPDGAAGAFADPRREFTRMRLLQIFQDVCVAVAYAHDREIIHRDLKPSNVMVGAYGEVYVVDWGLAKIIGQDEEERPASYAVAESAGVKESDSATALTIDGEIIGSLAYVSPEQAAGRIGEIDRQTDIFNLGGILYEILTSKPPFESESGDEILAKVRKRDLPPPSTRVSELRARAAEPRSEIGPEPAAAPWTPDPVPAELDRICMKAMSWNKSDRYSSALDIRHEIQEFLEGEKEIERRRQRAAELVEEGRKGLEKFRAIGMEIEEKEAALKKAGATTEFWAPVSQKKPLWKMEDDLKSLREQRMVEFSKAEVAFGEAIISDPLNPAGWNGKCDLYLERYLAAEARDDRDEMFLYRSFLDEYDRDMTRIAMLDRPGRITLRTFSRRCACLRAVRDPGWRVEFGEKPVIPWRDGLPAFGAAIEPNDFPVPETRIFPRDSGFGHGPGCGLEETPGADVWLFRFEERDRLLAPMLPRDVRAKGEGWEGGAMRTEETGRESRAPDPAPHTIPPHVLDRLYRPESPYRPKEGLYLGRTPIEAELPAGSYLCIVCHPDFRPVRVPAFVERGRARRMDLCLYLEDEVPEGFVQVPGGPFLADGKKAGGDTPREKEVSTSDCFMAEYPVTFGQYVEFLDHLCATGRRDEAAKRQPREGEHLFLAESGGMYRIPPPDPAAAPHESAAGEGDAGAGDKGTKAGIPRRLEANMPVMGVSWFDAMAYCAWRSTKDGRVYTPPHEFEWEKATRGADGRTFPFGDRIDGTFANTYFSREGGAVLLEVGAFPTDESPFGARDLGGSMSTWCLNATGNADYRDVRSLRGGSWFMSPDVCRAGMRWAYSPWYSIRSFGFRICFRASAMTPSAAVQAKT